MGSFTTADEAETVTAHEVINSIALADKNKLLNPLRNLRIKLLNLFYNVSIR